MSPEPTGPSRDNCDHPSLTTGGIPIISPGADALATSTIEEESGRRIRFKRTDKHPARGRIPAGLKVLIVAAFMIALGYGLVAPVLPSYARSFNVGVAATTIVVSALATTRLLFAPGAGKLITSFGERPVYTWGMMIVSVSSFINAAAWDYWVLLASRAFAGIGSVMFTVSAMGLLVRLAPPNMRGRISGYYATAFLLGNILGPVLGGALSGLGMRLPFAIYGVALLVSGAIVWFMMPSSAAIEAGRLEAAHATERRSEAKPAGTGDAGPSAQNPAQDEASPIREDNDAVKVPPLTVLGALKFSNYRSALVTNFSVGWAILGVQSSIIPLLAAYLATGGDPAKGSEGTLLASAVMAVGSGANALTQTVSGRISDAIGRRIMIFSGLVLCSCAVAGIGFASAPWVLLALITVLGVGAALMTPSLQAAIADIIGAKRDGGQVLATFQMLSDFGMILGPLLAGMVADTWGFTPAFLLCGALLALAASTWLPFMKPSWPRELADPEYTGR